jgi:dienelactone hydrolase
MNVQQGTPPEEYQPMGLLQTLYDAQEQRLTWPGGSTAEVAAWRRSLRRTLRRLLGGLDEPAAPLQPEVVERRRMEGYVREKVIYWTAPGSAVPAWVLIPDGAPARRPGVLCLHGHGRGKDAIVGLDAEGRQREAPGEYQADFAVQVAQRGMVALVPEQLGFGERRDPGATSPEQYTCTQASMAAFLLGKTMAGLRTRDALRGLDYLRGRPDVDGRRLGCIGISGGGTITLYLAALDERVKAAVISGYLNTYRASIFSLSHCADNYVPGILRYAEMADVAALIAPRPLYLQNGTRDHIFPIEATREAAQRLRMVYAATGVPDNFTLEAFDGGHEMHGVAPYAWLSRRLAAG